MKLNTTLLTGAVSAFIGILSGTAVTAYSMGVEKANFTQNIQKNENEIEDLKTLINNQLEILNGHVDQINTSIGSQTVYMGEIKTKVEVLGAIVERLEQKK